MMTNHHGFVGEYTAKQNMVWLSPSRTVVTSFNPKRSKQEPGSAGLYGGEYFDGGDWVLCVATNEDHHRVACALSNGEVQVYDKNTLHILHTFQRNESLITEMTFETFDANLLAATASDGSLTLYDIRQPTNPAIEIKNMLRQDEETLSLSMGFDGKIAAVGSSKGKIHFFDIRDKRSILGTYSQAHTNEVTRVRFQSFSTPSSGSSCINRNTSPVLVSGSEDGLACVFDTSQTTEESAITNILTVQSPVREIGFFGPKSEAIYCLTGSESLRLYHKDDAVCRKDFGPQFRKYLGDQLERHECNSNGHSHPSSAKPGSICSMEYLVDCHWDVERQELSMLAGSSKGDGAVFQVGEQGLSPLSHLRGGHRGVIRAWSSNHNRSSFFTVGEDARMCEWKDSSLGTGDNVNRNQIIVARKRQGGPIARVGGGKLRKPRSRMSSSPY
jgi:WD40 repeat protein